MKIGLLHDSILPPKNYGGIERIVVNLAEEYRRRGHEVVIFCRKGSHFSDFKYQYLPENMNAIGEQEFANLWPNDLTFLHSHQPLPFEPSLPYLITIHGNGHPQEKYFSNTNFLSQSHARNHTASVYVYNGVDPQKYPFVEKKSDHFVFLARTTWRVKNVKTAVRWAKDVNVPLEIIGGSGRSTHLIHYNGLLNEPEKVKILSTARALIYPTNWDEPCAAAPLEALACGTPVISSTNGCMPELVRPGTGIVCESYSDMFEAINNIRSIRPADCRRAVEEFFSLKRMTDDYLALIGRILKEGKLKQAPKYNFNKDSVRLLYKPTIWNNLSVRLRGKI